MFSFKANIIKRRKINKGTLLYGLIAAGLLGYAALTYLEMGFIPLLDKLVRQIGFYDYINWIYLGVFALLFMAIIPAIRTILQKKIKINGAIEFDEDNLKIVKGKEKYLIPESQLNEMTFELKPLPSEIQKKDGQLNGGNWMKIPTKKGTFKCELDINSPHQKEALMEMIEFLKIEHDVAVNVKEVK